MCCRKQGASYLPARALHASTPAAYTELALRCRSQRKDGGGGTGGGSKPRLGAELLVRLDAFLLQFLDGGYDLLMGHVSVSRFLYIRPFLGQIPSAAASRAAVPCGVSTRLPALTVARQPSQAPAEGCKVAGGLCNMGTCPGPLPHARRGSQAPPDRCMPA